MATTEPQIRIWHPADFKYRDAKATEHVNIKVPGLMNARLVDRDVTDSCTAGYVKWRATGKHEFTQMGDEVLFIVAGGLTLTSGHDKIVATAGDVVFMPKGTHATWDGSEELIIGYVSNIGVPIPDRKY